jgi:hypothetical protein
MRACVSIVFMLLLAASADAAPKRPGYFLGGDGCWHRTPKGVLDGKPKIKDCPGVPDSTQSSTSTRPGPPPQYSTATPAQVIAALECDIADAVKATSGKPTDLSKAVITGVLKFALVTKNSMGGKLAVAAIPVFSAATVAPSLEASRLTEVTYSDEWTIKVDAKAVSRCTAPSTNRWLTSKVMIEQGMVNVEKFVTKVAFVLTKKGGAGLNLNIIPISIGPSFSNENTNSQSLDLTIDYKPRADAPTQPAIQKNSGS